MNLKEISTALTDRGWRIMPSDILHPETLYLFKHAPTQYPCCSGGRDEDIRVEVRLSEFGPPKLQEPYQSIDLELCGMLPDQTWVKIQKWALPLENPPALLKHIPDMIAAWEQMFEKTDQ